MTRADHGSSSPFLAWPGWRHLRFALVVGVLWTMMFYAVYGGASFLTAQHSFRLRCDFPFEQIIPFVPAMSLAYLFLLGAMALSPFVIRERRAYLHYALVLTLELLVAGFFFVLLPTRSGFDAPVPQGPFAGVFRLAHFLNLGHNNLPSIHVAFAVTTARTYASRTREKRIQWGLAGLAGLVVASTVLTHQHHLVDVIMGYFLAVVVESRFPRKRPPQEASEFTLPEPSN